MENQFFYVFRKECQDLKMEIEMHCEFRVNSSSIST